MYMTDFFGPWHSGPMRVVARPKLTGFGRHVGLQLPDGSVVHLTDVGGVQLTSLDDFAQGRAVTPLFNVEPALHDQVLDRIRVAIAEQRPYDVANWNCECLVNWLIGAPAKSPTATAVATIAVVAGVALAVAR